MKNHLSFRRTRQTVAALSGSVALLLGALDAPTQAATKTWTGRGFPVPDWGPLLPNNWSTPGVPTAYDDVIFPAVVPPALSPALAKALGLRADGSQINLSRLFPLLRPPTANSLTFLNSYLFTSRVGVGLNTSTFLRLNAGVVTVAAEKTAILNVDIQTLSGQLTKRGPGTLLLGRTVTGNVLVEEGTLGGTPLILGNVINEAILAPGYSPGTFRVGTNYNQTEGGRLRIEIASAENLDLLQIRNRAELDGELDVSLLGNYRPKRGQKLTFLTAGGGVSGEFDEVNAPVWDNLTLRAFYDDERVYLKPVIYSFEAVAQTPNQRAVAQVLDEVIYDQRAEKVINYLYKQDFGKLPGDFDRIAPEELTSIFTISTSLAVVQNTNLQRRTDDIRHGASGFSASGLAMQGTGPGYSGSLAGMAGPTGKETKDVVAPAPEEKKWGVFLTGVGEWVDVGGDGNARGYDISTGGFTLGLDYKVTPNFVVGIAAGYAGTSADLTNGGDVSVNGGKLGVYATFFQNAVGAAGPTGKETKDVQMPVSLGGGFYADVAVNGGYNSYDTERSALQGTARGSTDGGELNVLVGAGYDWKIGALTIGPTATYQYSLVGINSFTETGSLAPLNIGSRNAESIRTTLGFKASYDWKIGGVLVRPEIRAAWQHEYGDSSYGLDASFANGAGNSFLVNGPEIGRDSLLIGAGVAIQCSERFSTYLYYDGELARSNYDRHGVSGGVRVSF